MKIKKVRGATEKDVLSKEFNIYMGISLGNKWFTKENIKEYILWGLKHTKEKFAIEIGDTLNAINYQIRSKYSKEASIRKAIREGDRFEKIVREILGELSSEDKSKIDIVRWDYIRKQSYYKKMFPFFVREFKDNSIFGKEIKNIVKDFYTNILKRKSDDKRIEILSVYILDELPELLNGFIYEGTSYNCWIYPLDTSLGKLVQDIQNKKKFSEFHDKIEVGQNVLVVLN